MKMDSTEPIPRAVFLDFVNENEDGRWIDGAAAARELGLHLAAEELVHGWLTFEEQRSEEDEGDDSTETHIVTDRRYLIVSVAKRSTLRLASAENGLIEVQSVPIGRLRSVCTDARHTIIAGAPDDAVSGELKLDFAGPVFHSPFGNDNRDELSFHQHSGWPSQEVQAFMAALATVRK